MAVIFDGKCLLLLFILALIPRCQTQNCSSNLTKILVYEGNSTSLERVNSSQPVQWAVISSSDFLNEQQIITNYDDVVVSQFNTTYAVTPSGLTIFNATVAPQGDNPYATAGLYIIRYQNSGCICGFNLIVISGLVGSRNESDPNNVTLSCRIDYAESRIRPHIPVFAWWNGTSVVMQEQPIPYNISSYLTRSVSQLSIDRSDVTKYTCNITFQSITKSPYNCVTGNFSVIPTFGPAAGGTVVTIVAEWMELENISISAVYIGQNLQANISHTSTEKIFVTTPAIGNYSQINQQLPIILEIFPNSINITTGKYFTYKPNPRINDVSPRELLISGGILLTISGTSLDSVPQPMVRAAVVIRRGSVITSNNQSFSSCYPPTQNGSQMICLSPPIYIRDDFLQQLFSQTNPYSNNRRKRKITLNYGWKSEDRAALHDTGLLSVRSKRSAAISTNETYTLHNSDDKMEIYVGIVFDGFRRYETDILTDSSGSFKLCNPTLNCKGHIEFDDTIDIQGGNLMQCYRQSDYTVRIGNGICTVANLTDNALTCSPPKNKPQQTESDSHYNCGKNFVVIVEIGSKSHICSCLKYPNDDITNLIIIIAATVGSFVVVLIIITVIVVVVIKSKKAKKQAPTREFIENQLRENSYTSSDHHLRNDIRPTTEGNSRVTYRRQIDTIYVNSRQLPGSFSESRNQMSYEPDNYLNGAYLSRPTADGCNQI